MKTSSDSLNVASFNCRSVKNSASAVKDLCQMSDIVLLQEHWLLPNDLNFLSSLDKDFLTYGTSAVDIGNGPLCEVTVLWRKSLGITVSIVSEDDDRILAIRITNDAFGLANDMAFCEKKTNCMYFPCKRVRLQVMPPSVTLNSRPLPYVQSVSYLGFHITSDLSDDDSIRNQTRYLYTKANTLSRTFGSCSAEAKRLLFMSHCCPLYCVQVWSNHSAAELQRVRVAFHDALKIITSQPRSSSNSCLFALMRVDTFDARRRKLTHSFAARLLASQNDIIRVLSDFDVIATSMFWKSYGQVHRPRARV
uniref:Endonuclease/exonuclease/phosphatase domain-containing protein n=1 Tax=Branchiostoma floridae TaxID=7739 RepID=C3YHE1_BRAFL|eukprot:XP_002604366.1 hypothetical protein BRAFLDRAFT_85458 [Branchiostoma floridae]